jgi:hypothetical protein
VNQFGFGKNDRILNMPYKDIEKAREKARRYYWNNREARLKYARENQKDNSEYQKEWFQKNKDKVRARKKQYKLDNPELVKAQKAKHDKAYRLKNPEAFKKTQKKAYLRKRKNPLERFKYSVRARTYQAFKRNYWIKNSGSEKLLGCDWETAIKHIESQFEPWMTWDNYGKWQIDHIIPLASAKTKKEVEQLCRYTNLQPLKTEENQRKGDKILV